MQNFHLLLTNPKSSKGRIRNENLFLLSQKLNRTFFLRLQVWEKSGKNLMFRKIIYFSGWGGVFGNFCEGKIEHCQNI